MNSEFETKEPKKNNRLKALLPYGTTAFLVVCASMLVFFFIFQGGRIASVLSTIMVILQPIILGLAIAYVLNSPMTWIEGKLLGLFQGTGKKQLKMRKATRGISVFVTMTLALLFIAVLFQLVMPEIYNSIVKLIQTLPGQVSLFQAWFMNILHTDSNAAAIIDTVITNGTGYLQNWLQADLLPRANSMIGSVTTGVIGVFKGLLNLIIGLTVAVYVLLSKETFTGQIKKIFYAFLKPKHANVLLETIRKSNEIFGGFIIGKIIDSTIIGLLCFICLTILNMPYTVLVSVIVGVTNVIPFFGPYIGAIPSAFLILLANPMQGLYFIIFIIILQQIDGNIIGPKILGDSTGLSAFWVVVSILMGGGLFGFVGMLIGVPTFAVLYHIFKQIVEYRLGKRSLPVESGVYQKLECIEPEGNRLVYMDEEKEGEKPESEKK